MHAELSNPDRDGREAEKNTKPRACDCVILAPQPSLPCQLVKRPRQAPSSPWAPLLERPGNAASTLARLRDLASDLANGSLLRKVAPSLVESPAF